MDIGSTRVSERASARDRGPGTAAGRPSGPGAGMGCGAPETPTPGPRGAPQHPGGRARARKSPALGSASPRFASSPRLAGFPPSRALGASPARSPFPGSPGERVTAQWPRGKGRGGMGRGEGDALAHTHTHTHTHIHCLGRQPGGRPLCPPSLGCQRWAPSVRAGQRLLAPPSSPVRASLLPPAWGHTAVTPGRYFSDPR